MPNEKYAVVAAALDRGNPSPDSNQHLTCRYYGNYIGCRCLSPTRVVLATRLEPHRWSFVADHLQIIPILSLGHGVCYPRELFLVNKTHPKCHLLKAGNLQSLTVFDRGDVI